MSEIVTRHLVSTRVDISEAIASAPAPVVPEGWSAELYAAVQEGRISYRRALAIVATGA